MQKLHLPHHLNEELVDVLVGARRRLEERTRPLLSERLALCACHLSLRPGRAGRRASREVQLIADLNAAHTQSYMDSGWACGRVYTHMCALDHKRIDIFG